MCYHQGRTVDERGVLALSRRRKREQKDGERREATVGNLPSRQVVDSVGDWSPDRSDSKHCLSKIISSFLTFESAVVQTPLKGVC